MNVFRSVEESIGERFANQTIEKIGRLLNGKRAAKEWHNAIIYIIKNHKGSADYDNFYSEIPRIMVLNNRELRPSTKGANYEPVWRGTLRGYLSDMVFKGVLTKNDGIKKKPVFSVSRKFLDNRIEAGRQALEMLRI